MTDFSEFIRVVRSAKSDEELEDFLTAITTEEEQEKLAQRIAIVRLLLAGHSHQSIAKDLGVGVATVTRGSKELNKGHFDVLRKEAEKNGTIKK